MEQLQSKIEKKNEELNKLRAQAADLKAKKIRSDFKKLNEYLAAKNVSPDEAMDKLKEVYGD